MNGADTGHPESRSWWRIAWLIGLTLVAGTLPASGWAVTIVPDDADAEPACPDTPAPADSDPAAGEDADASFEIAPDADAWHGTTARLRGRSAVAPLMAALPSPTERITVRPTHVSPPSCPAPLRQDEPAQHRWLVCRYAHAPPLSN